MSVLAPLASSTAPKVNLFKLHPGKSIDIEINHPVKVRLKLPLIGYELGKYIILKSPVTNKSTSYQDVLVEGNVVIARYILEGEHGECFAFRSTIKHITQYPESFLILNYPLKIESRQLRLQQRIVTHLPASVVVDTNKEGHQAVRLNGIITDISTKGCGFLFKADNSEITVKKRDIFVSVQHPSTGEIKIPARICNSRNDQGNVSVGIQFFDGDKQVSNLLEHLFINESLL